MTKPHSPRAGQARIKPGGVILILFFAGLLAAVGAYKLRDQLFPKPKGPGDIDPAVLTAIREGRDPSTASTPAAPPAATVPAQPGTTTVDAYKFVGRQGVSDAGSAKAYEFKDRTVVFPINIWGGWAPIVMANNGFSPSAESVFAKKYGFKLDLKLIDDPEAARAAYVSGQSHVLWGTLDMIALFAEGLAKDPRVMPKVFQQIDWSNGGDGVVVRGHVQQARDLRGKEIALAQHSPSHYYILTLLTEAGIGASEVTFRFTDTAFGAARAFVENNQLAACVSWAPDIYNIIDPAKGGKPGGVNGAYLLTTTGDADHLIADVWAARADFAKDHPDVIKGLVAGIFEGMDMVEKDPGKAARLLADGFGLSPDDTAGMMKDAHLTGFEENLKFFLDKDNPTNFERTWAQASYVYKAYGSIGSPVRAEDVKDAGVLFQMKQEGKFAHQKDKYTKQFPSRSPTGLNVEANPILTKAIMVHFAPNSWTLDPAVEPGLDGKIEEIGRLAGKFGAARIVIEGNVDTSRKLEIQRQGQRIFEIFSKDVTELSEKRAGSVREAVLKKFKDFPANKITSIGNGWDNPISLTDHSQNRRVEIKVFPMEGN